MLSPAISAYPATNSLGTLRHRDRRDGGGWLTLAGLSTESPDQLTGLTTLSLT